jgi:hypothetical protein
MEATGDLIDDDAFEPVPLSRIEGIQPTSKQVADEQTTLSSAEHGLSMFEPRPIERMLDQPNGASALYTMTPTLPPRQQAWLEYVQPFFLPWFFSFMNLSKFGIVWCYVLCAGHTLQTLYTSFGPVGQDLSYKPVIGLLQHQFMDSMWMHTLFSAMLLGPEHFGPTSVYIAVALLPLLPMNLSVSLKTHFQTNVLANATIDGTRQSIKRKQRSIHWVGETMKSSFIWYFTAIVLVLLGHRCTSFNLMVLGVFVMNMAPLTACETYRYHFKKSSNMLIHKQKLL